MKKMMMIIAVALLLAACGGKKVDEETSEIYIGKAEEVVALLNAGDTASVHEMLDANMKEALTADQLEEVTGLIQDSGEFKEVDKSSVEEDKGHFITVLAVKYSEGTRVFTITFNDSQEVAGLYIK
ncbi:DUF3887 domain-containing protein [Sporosarcina cascadiensis]|uniref:DUF3887 domain-containing protein n=1 Tax=Sporosarcina cascadiensis TaxID=2660747 RepID=UPI00189174AE|nr:DUF3887 domain-containing protein [Sporosarcina cascadiensis]